MRHVVLLGDSIFDNSRYVHPKPDVVTQLQEILPEGWQASLRAVDGATTENVPPQLSHLPAGATHLVLSVGGNDLLGRSSELLQTPVSSTSEAFLLLAEAASAFESRYRRVLDACAATGLPLIVCTIYNGNFPDQEFQTVARVAVAMLNDAILRLALERHLRTIDLRAICTEPRDYANPIEPSAVGGRKIVQAIWQVISREP